MRKILFLPVIFLFFISCNNNSKTIEVSLANEKSADSAIKHIHTFHLKDSTQEIKEEDVLKLDNYLVTTAPDSDITLINRKCALVIYPTSDQSDEMQKQMGDDNYSVMVDDAAFYQSQCIEAIKKRNIETINIDPRYIKFVTNNKTFLFDRCAKVSGGWMVILFRPDSLPRIVGAVEADVALDSYFGK